MRDSVRRTLPIDMKKPNVAPDESMYCASVAIAPRGPGPALVSADAPQDLEAAADEADREADARAHDSAEAGLREHRRLLRLLHVHDLLLLLLLLLVRHGSWITWEYAQAQKKMHACCM